MTAVRHSLIIEKAYSWTPIKQHIAHFMTWEKKNWAVLWLKKNTLAYVKINLSTASAWQRISAVCKKSNHLWIPSVCISLGQEKSQQSKPGFGKNLAPNSETIIWTIHLDKKKDPAVMCWAQDPGDLIQLGKTVPQTARHQSPWFPKEGMKENTGIPHRCFNTYGQLMTRQKCQVKFLVGDWQKGVIKKSPELSNYTHSYGPPKRGFLVSSDYV